MKHTNIITEAKGNTILTDIEEKWWNSKDKEKKSFADEASSILDWFYKEKSDSKRIKEYNDKKNEFIKMLTKANLYKNGNVLESLNESEILESKLTQSPEFKYKGFTIVRKAKSHTQGVYSIHKGGIELLSFNMSTKMGGETDGRKNMFLLTDDEIKKSVDVALKNPKYKKQLDVNPSVSEPTYVKGQKYSTDSGLGGTESWEYVGDKGGKLTFKIKQHKDYGGNRKIIIDKKEADKKFFDFVK